MEQQMQFTSPMRDKYWKEKSTEQKLEVLADLLASAHRQIRTLTERLDELGNHSHHPVTQQVLVPARDQYAFSTGRIGPPGYNHEEFLLGRSPDHLYAPPAAPSWQSEAQAEGSLPTAGSGGSPATAPENGFGSIQMNPLGGLDKSVEEPSEMADPDWPKEPKNRHFHPDER